MFFIHPVESTIEVCVNIGRVFLMATHKFENGRQFPSISRKITTKATAAIGKG
jgi:hypothetical protein